ncbi:UNVERIFIED_CONTAM: hypothetical protein Sangu_1726100 [Sesamum angustifolium]|uniref:Uncharacterized protein n=1 Tax=Sesamum angustifolium TaxID=2727405 RepID=A0AAW2M7M1_9LAMI
MAIQEPMVTLVPTCIVTPLEVNVPKEKGERVSPAPASQVVRGQGPPLQAQQDVPPQWLWPGAPGEKPPRHPVPYCENALE